MGGAPAATCAKLLVSGTRLMEINKAAGAFVFIIRDTRQRIRSSTSSEKGNPWLRYLRCQKTQRLPTNV